MKRLLKIVIAMLAVILISAGCISRKDQEQFEKAFGVTSYPVNEHDRLYLRPIVIKELITQKVALEGVEQKVYSTRGKISQASRSNDEITVLTAAIGELETLERHETTLWNKFRNSCSIAYEAGFKREVEAARCRPIGWFL